MAGTCSNPIHRKENWGSERFLQGQPGDHEKPRESDRRAQDPIRVTLLHAGAQVCVSVTQINGKN